MPLIKDSQIVEDNWTHLADDAQLAAGAWPIVSLERWQAERERLMEAGVPLGLRLRSDQSPRQIADELEHFAVIALAFPKFTDGRPYSSARLLRERYGFAGELRAIGNVLRDQALFMVRCGFDAFEVEDDTALDAWRAALTRISVRYQATADGGLSASRLRLRKASAKRPPQAVPGHQTQPRNAEEPCAARWAY